MARFLHTMYRITDPERSRAFYEASPRRTPREAQRGLNRLTSFTEDMHAQGHRTTSSELERGEAEPPQYVQEQLDLQQGAHTVVLERLAESLAILSEACAGISPQQRGAHYVAEGPPDWPRPAQERIPLLVGGGGKEVLELAGAQADIVSISRNMQRGTAGSWRRLGVGHDGGPERMDERVRWVREAAGERFERLELQAIVGKAVVTKDRKAGAAAVGAPLGLAADEVLASPHFLVGTVEEMAHDLERRRERWGISYWTLSVGNVSGIDAVHEFARVIARLR